jgi:hypothetical protein
MEQLRRITRDIQERAWRRWGAMRRLRDAGSKSCRCGKTISASRPTCLACEGKIKSAVNTCARDKVLDRDEVRTRLRSMSDDTLKQFGKAARYMCSPQAQRPGTPPRENYVIQLEEAIAEWRRRAAARAA